MRHILVLFTLLLLPALLAGQPSRDPSGLRTLSGLVLDGKTYEPLAGASVRVLLPAPGGTASTEYGAVTREDGSFRIEIPHRDTVILAATFVGYREMRLMMKPGEDSTLFELQQEESLLPEVEVVAVRRTRSVEDACCRVESIRDEVQQHAPFSPSALDVLSRYSSCTSSRVSCAIDNSASTRLRGLEPTYVKVLIDGLPAFSGLSTFYGLNAIPAHALQTVRITEGASSGLYGNGAVSGVVDLETRPPTEMPELTLSGNLSGDGGIQEAPAGRDLNLSYTGLAGEVGIAAFGSYANHADEHLSGGLGRGYERASGLLKGNMLLGNATELILSALGNWDRRDGTHLAPGELNGYREEVRLGRLDLSARVGHTIDEASEVTAAALISTVGIDGSYGPVALDASQRTLYSAVRYLHALEGHTLQAGGEFYNDRLTERNGSALGIGYDLGILSLFAQDEMALSETWSVLGSLRMDRHSMAGILFSPRAALRFAPLSTMTMRLMAGQGFKGEALFNEEHLTLHGVYRWRANEEYRYERSFTLNYDISYSFLIGDEAGVDANFNMYYTTITGKGIPHADSLAAGTLFYINSDRPARLTGLELQLRPTFGEHWSGSLAIALINYALQGSDGNYRQMPLAPRANVDASLMYRNQELGFTAETWGSYIGAQRLPANPFGVEESVPYTLVNARLEKSFGVVAAFVGVTNLLDARQSDTMPLDFATETGHANGGIVWGPMEGREFFLGARLTLGGSTE